ncbi:MAG TPA: hypothetical protein VF669_00215 [Tepidisphaeraceae bacterium]
MAISGRRPWRPDGKVYRGMRRTRVSARTMLEGQPPRRRSIVKIFTGAVKDLVSMLRKSRGASDAPRVE